MGKIWPSPTFWWKFQKLKPQLCNSHTYCEFCRACILYLSLSYILFLYLSLRHRIYEYLTVLYWFLTKVSINRLVKRIGAFISVCLILIGKDPNEFTQKEKGWFFIIGSLSVFFFFLLFKLVSQRVREVFGTQLNIYYRAFWRK